MDDHRDFPPPDLAELVGSRLCHDLVNPISAISNGLELLALSGAVPTPEIELIGDAVRDAMARIRFFRIAFGAARPGEMISARETREILAEIYGTSRLDVRWQIGEDLPRADTKLGFLLLNAAETAFPLGGTLSISRGASGWMLEASGRKMSVEDANWQALITPGLATSPPPARVQFALLTQELAARDAALSVTMDTDTLCLAMAVSA